MENLKQVKSFDELLDGQYGKIGTPRRDEFERKATAFVISELLKDLN